MTSKPKHTARWCLNDSGVTAPRGECPCPVCGLAAELAKLKAENAALLVAVEKIAGFDDWDIADMGCAKVARDYAQAALGKVKP